MAPGIRSTLVAIGLVTVFVMILALASCSTPTPTVDLKVNCLPMRVYSPEEQARAAAELSALKADSVLAGFMTDYATLRTANRACMAVGKVPVP